jgi:hypothetical protein
MFILSKSVGQDFVCYMLQWREWAAQGTLWCRASGSSFLMAYKVPLRIILVVIFGRGHPVPWTGAHLRQSSVVIQASRLPVGVTTAENRTQRHRARHRQTRSQDVLSREPLKAPHAQRCASMTGECFTSCGTACARLVNRLLLSARACLPSAWARTVHQLAHVVD